MSSDYHSKRNTRSRRYRVQPLRQPYVAEKVLPPPEWLYTTIPPTAMQLMAEDAAV